MTLEQRAKKVCLHLLIVQRLKRLRSIGDKLRATPAMELSRMQDIGGCRAVLDDVEQVRSLAKKYEVGQSKNPRTQSELVKTFDYISTPKLSGNRST